MAKWIIGLFIIIAFSFSTAKANDYYDCPGMAVQVTDLPPVYKLTAHYPHVFVAAKSDSGSIEGIGTDTLTVVDANIIQAETRCEWRVWLPIAEAND